MSSSEVATWTGEVLAEPERCASQDVPKSGRVFRVIVCEACHWQYGAWWLRAKIYSYWGDCPHCGKVTTVATSYRWNTATASVSSEGARAAAGSQQELGF